MRFARGIHGKVRAVPERAGLAGALPAGLGWGLGGAVLVAYYSFILVIAFKPAWLVRPLGPTTAITVGIAAGLAIIALCVALTGVYIWQANRDFDRKNREIVDDARRNA